MSSPLEIRGPEVPGQDRVLTPDAIGFLDPASKDYRLSPKSAFKGRAKGGKDPGADFARIRSATQGVIVR